MPKPTQNILYLSSRLWHPNFYAEEDNRGIVGLYSQSNLYLLYQHAICPSQSDERTEKSSIHNEEQETESWGKISNQKVLFHI